MLTCLIPNDNTSSFKILNHNDKDEMETRYSSAELWAFFFNNRVLRKANLAPLPDHQQKHHSHAADKNYATKWPLKKKTPKKLKGFGHVHIPGAEE